MLAARANGELVIIGGGCSGVLTAIQVARQARSGLVTITLIESQSRLGRGIAYATQCTAHVLNVPAGDMSAWPDDPGHFVRWARGRDHDVDAGDYLPRGLYGEYLEDVLRQVRAAGGVQIRRVRARAVDLVDGGRRGVVLAGGRCVRADQVVLAVGPFPPADPAIEGLERLTAGQYVRDPWQPGRFEQLPAEAPCLLLGTGLTMVDVAVELHGRGHRGELHAVSRRGLLPQVHVDSSPPPISGLPPEVERAPRTPQGLLRGVRAAVRREQEQGHDWRAVLGSLRPHTSGLWSALSPEQRLRFLRHLNPHWSVHRHRLAPAAALMLRALRASGRLQLHTGRVLRVVADGDGLQTLVQPRGGGQAYELPAARIFNCTGPDLDVRRTDDELWRSLLRRGWVQPDPLGMGIVADDLGAVCDATGRASNWLHVVGPLRRGQLWECTAVPEIRVATARLAARLCAAQVERTGRTARVGQGVEGVRP